MSHKAWQTGPSTPHSLANFYQEKICKWSEQKPSVVLRGCKHLEQVLHVHSSVLSSHQKSFQTPLSWWSWVAGTYQEQELLEPHLCPNVHLILELERPQMEVYKQRDLHVRLISSMRHIRYTVITSVPGPKVSSSLSFFSCAPSTCFGPRSDSGRNR